MSDDQHTLSDAALMSLFNSDDDLSILSPAERSRMLTLTAEKKEPPPAAAAPKKAEGGWEDTLPMIGGAIGGMAAKVPVLGPLAAGVGGAAGEGYRQLVKHGGEIPGAIADVTRNFFSGDPAVNAATIKGAVQGAGEGALNAGKAGAEQAAYEAGGRLLGAAVKPVAKGVYAAALRPSRVISREVGGGNAIKGAKQIVDQAFEDTVLPSKFGIGRAERKLGESAAKATDIAAKSPHQVATSRVFGRAESDQAARMAKELADAGIKPKPNAVRQQIDRLINANSPARPAPSPLTNIAPGAKGLSANIPTPPPPAMMPMSRLLEVRRGADTIAKPIFDAAKLPGGAGRVPLGTEASVAKSVADAARQPLNDILGPAFQKVNQTSQAQNALVKALKDASGRSSFMTNALAGTAGLASAATGQGDTTDAIRRALIVKALMSPNAWGAGALALGKAAPQLPRLMDTAGMTDFGGDAEALLQALMGQEEQQEQ